MSRNGPGRDRELFGALGSLGELLETIRRAAEDGSLPDQSTTNFGPAAQPGLGRGMSARSGQSSPGSGDGVNDPAARVDRPTHVTPDGADRLVTVDLGDLGVDTAGDLSVALEDRTLVVGVEGTTVAQTDLPEGTWTVGMVRLNNGVFEARIRPD